MKSILIDEVEAAIEKIYDSYSISNEDRLLVEAYMDELLAKEREKYMVELDGLTREKIRLDRRQEKLLEAHFNDAIPLDLMKREQKSISKQLAAIEHEIKAHNATFDDIKDKLSLVMEMIEDCGRTYRQANENIKKLLNQAFFEKIWIEEDDRVTPELTAVCVTVIKAKREIKKSTSASADVDSACQKTTQMPPIPV